MKLIKKSMKMKKNKTIYLSYFTDESTPIYGGKKTIKFNTASSIKNGDSSNTMSISFSNHTGTHIDFPKHFDDTGNHSNDYSPEFWFFKNPFLIHKACEEDEIITLSKSELESIPKETDFLILKTDFFKIRDSKKYWNNNPGLSPKLYHQLADRLKKLRVIGGDYISVSSYQNRELGRIAHREFLASDNPILLVEDMDLSKINISPKQIFCFPLLINKSDGAPVTIIAQL